MILGTGTGSSQLQWSPNESYVLSRRSRVLLASETRCGVVLMLATAMGTRWDPSSQLRARVLGPAPYGNEHRCPRVLKKGCADLEAHKGTRKYHIHCCTLSWSVDVYTSSAMLIYVTRIKIRTDRKMDFYNKCQSHYDRPMCVDKNVSEEHTASVFRTETTSKEKCSE
jgi:hypothetical protein